jgi:hypothetical protein
MALMFGRHMFPALVRYSINFKLLGCDCAFLSIGGITSSRNATQCGLLAGVVIYNKHYWVHHGGIRYLPAQQKLTYLARNIAQCNMTVRKRL